MLLTSAGLGVSGSAVADGVIENCGGRVIGSALEDRLPRSGPPPVSHVEDVKSVLASVRALEGDASRRILDVAKHVLADVIVMGSRGHSTIGELLLGSVAHKVTMKADIPVMLVPIDR